MASSEKGYTYNIEKEYQKKELQNFFFQYFTCKGIIWNHLVNCHTANYNNAFYSQIMHHPRKQYKLKKNYLALEIFKEFPSKVIYLNFGKMLT